MKRYMQNRLFALSALAAGFAANTSFAAAGDIDWSTPLTAMQTQATGGLSAAAPIVLGLIGAVIAVGIVIRLVKKA